MFTEKVLIKLAENEGWGVERDSDTGKMLIYTDHGVKPLAHPYQIHCGIYRSTEDISMKLHSAIRLNHILWPDYEKTWNDWDQRRFEAHCSGWKNIVLAGGASTAKSNCTARIACIFWLSDPLNNACLIASTTLDSLERRIWGYATGFIEDAKKRLPLPVKLMRAVPPKVLHVDATDKRHGMFAVAISKGSEEKVLSTLIGNHPNKGIMVVLDESTDMPPAITKAFPNLEKGVDFAQFWAIGNSNSKNDLHGSLATPKISWEKVNTDMDSWPTVHEKGICLYFNPYKSPAITDPDPEKRKLLGRFLMTESGLKKEEKKYGTHSDSFYRFVLGFWKQQSLENVLLERKFLLDHKVTEKTEWAGVVPIRVVAGLDPAFQVGGTGCILRLGFLGVDTTGKYVLDFKDDRLLFKLDVRVDSEVSSEMQLVYQIIEILKQFNCPLSNVGIDATGLGRALGELLKIVYVSDTAPLKFVSTRASTTGKTQKSNTDPSIQTVNPTEMWMTLKEFILYEHIRGLDSETIYQLENRKVELVKNSLILETKGDYKTRMTTADPGRNHSPDEADSMIIALMTAIHRLGFKVGQHVDMNDFVLGNDTWAIKMRAMRAAEKSMEAVDRGGFKGLPVLAPEFKEGF